MIGLSYKASTLTAWVLTEIFTRFPDKPKINSPATSCQTFCARPSVTSVLQYISAEITTTLRLPTLATSHPASGKESMSPTGKVNSTAPNSASVSPSCCCMLGIREAQVAKESPYKKNIEPTAIL